MEVDRVRAGQHPLVSRLLKGVYLNSRPGALRYSSTWDVTRVLTLPIELTTNSPFKSLHTRFQSLRPYADRCSDLAALIGPQSSLVSDKWCEIHYHWLTMSRRNGPPIEAFYPSQDHQSYVQFEPWGSMKQDLRRGDRLGPPTPSLSQSESSMLLWNQVPYVAKWIKRVMADSRDISVFSAHSTCTAVTSKAKAVGKSTTDILRAANWSSEATFCPFYHRPVSSSGFNWP